MNFSQEFAEESGLNKNVPQKFTRTSPKTWEDNFLEYLIWPQFRPPQMLHHVGRVGLAISNHSGL